MEPKTLSSYVAERVHGGVSKADIKEQALAVGWSEDEADAAYAEALIAEGMPVPEAAGSGSYAKRSSTVDIVLNFFSFILLGVVVTALGVLYFEIIAKYFPDALAGNSYYSASRSIDSIHYAIAALVIGFPLYYIAVRLWFKKFRQDEAKTESRLTKWITYLILLAASVTVVGDLIAILFTFLQGEISARFFLKALVVLVLAGMIFTFYYLERKKIQYRQDIPRKKFQIFAYVLTGIVVVGIILGFMVAGGPNTERQRSFDERRAGDLQAIAGCVRSYTQQFERLPNSLAAMEETSSLRQCADRHDPDSDEAYEYRIIQPLQNTTQNRKEAIVELCAAFSLSSDTGKGGDYYRATKWYDHGQGVSCDNETIVITVEDVEVPFMPTPLPL